MGANLILEQTVIVLSRYQIFYFYYVLVVMFGFTCYVH